MEAYQGIKRIKDILSGAGIKGRIKVGPELIGIGSVLNIAYNAGRKTGFPPIKYGAGLLTPSMTAM
jgi:hypothetical protein